MTDRHPTPDRRIAIIGIGCRFPGGADTPERYWSLLSNGVDAIGDIPLSRWDNHQLFDPDVAAPGKLNVTRGGFLDDVAGFDAEFFGMSPREALHVDPQQRLLLEMAYEAFEDAGLVLDRLAGTPTGVFVGMSTHDYGDMQMYPGNRGLIDARSNVGVATSLAANRISYAYDLRGPSMSVDTACSSALTATHLAIASLRRGECSMALTAGIQLMLTPEVTIGFSKATMLSPDGRCAAFDAAANGYVRSEGGAVLLLKPLEAALADGDRVYAVLEGSAINEDGRTTGMTVPSSDAQAAMLRSALDDAGVDASELDYIEAHGTGTPVGDPLEAGAIGSVVGAVPGRHDRLAIGSAKTNVGHLEAAAGMAGLCKTVMALYHRQIPPSLHFHTPNPAIDFDQLRLRVVTELEPWPSSGPGLAGVNSFGFGGANAHVVVGGLARPDESAGPPAAGSGPKLLVASARSAGALTRQLTSFADSVSRLSDGSPDDLAAFCRAAATRRSHHDHRAAAVAETPEDMAELLRALADGQRRAAGAVGRARPADARVAFVFAGMGPQWWAMGRSLATSDPDFREVLARCEAALRGITPWSLTEELLRDEDDSRVTEPELAQVTNFAVQTGLTAVLARFGIAPDAVIGHSAGEMAAACAAGVLSLEAGAVLAWHRGRLQGRTAGMGRMLAVGLPEAEAVELLDGLDGKVALAAVNDPSSVTLSGDEDALTTIAERLTEQQRFARFLSVDVPYHSAHMDSIGAELREALTFLEPTAAKVPMMSVVDAGWVSGGELDGDYWWRNVRQPVRFADGIRHLLDDGFTTFLEVSPHPVLVASVSGCLAGRSESAAAIGSLRRGGDDLVSLLRSLTALWTRGVEVDWDAVHGPGPDRAALPTYAWDREHLWFESAAAPRVDVGASAPWVHPLLGWRLPTAVPQWQAELADPKLAWLDDHVLRSTVVHPGAAYVEAVLAAAHSLGATQPAARDISLRRALVLAPRADVRVQCALGERGVSVHAGAAGDGSPWEEHAVARFDEAGVEPPPAELTELRSQCPRSVPAEEIYAGFARRGLNYGPSFTGIADVRIGEGRALAQLVLPAAAGSTDGYLVHPALLDSAFQMLLLAAGDSDDALFVPVQIDRVVVYRPVGRSCWGSARIVRETLSDVIGEVDLLDEDGTVLVTVRGLRCRPLDERSAAKETVGDWLYELRWEAPPDGSGGRSVLERSSPDVLAPISQGATALAAQQGWSSYYSDVEPALQAASSSYVVGLLRDSGWDPDRPLDVDELVTKLAPAPDRARHARALLDGLVGDGWLVDSEGLLVAGAPAPADPEQVLDDLVAAHPAFATDVALLRRAGASLGAVLRGDVGGAETLLGDEGAQLLEHFYRDAQASLFTNTLVRQAAAALTERRDEARPLRVLEIGGGTGGTTTHLRAVLPEDTQYVFTDISPVFTQAMAVRTAEVETRVFDLERPLEAQGMTAGYDLVVAANVVHATADLARSTQRLRELLAPDGRLLLVEITRPLLWLDLVFGASAAWWAYDDAYRSTGALLDPDGWLTVLGDAGFDDIRVIADGPEVGPPGQCVLVATRPVETTPAVLEPSGLWTVSGDGPLAETLRGRLGALEVLAQDDSASTGVIHVAESSPATDDLGEPGLLAFVDAVREIVREHAGALPDGIWVITTGAQRVGDSEPQPALAALWGMVRVARKEFPERTWRLLDLPPEPTTDDLDRCLALVFGGAPDGEDEVAVRQGRQFVRRLRRLAAPASVRPALPEEGWRVDVERPGSLDSAAPRPVPRRAPGHGEVEVRIDAASCNFRDVMIASGLLPPIASEGTFADRLLGLDLAGTVVACGQGVDDLAPGDAVFGIGPGTFGSYATTSAELVAPVPPGLDLVLAAATPCAFVTAVYALEHIARLRAGERVLIHAATGGVGLAALQVARSLGAQVLATAGSDEKRALLRDAGIEHVFDSRSLDFAEGVLAATDGAGVDVVLNSLSGPAIAAGLRCLARYGRFVEIGKRDIYEDAPLALFPFRRNLSFSAVDLDLLCRERPEVAGSMLRLVAGRLADGTYEPLPVTTFPVDEVDAALRLLGQARHIGKVVIDVASSEVVLDAPPPRSPRCRRDGSYLVTGGTGGFGREVAGWLADEGAGAIALLSRSGLDEAALAAVRLRCAPARVEVLIGDVGVEADLRRALDEIHAQLLPLRGVVHAAMTLADAPLIEVTAGSLHDGMHAKAGGLVLLDRLTADDDLDLFVVFSSISSLLGNPSQGAYAAANASMAALVHVRRAAGKSGTVIDWGVLGEAGYVAQNPEIAAFLDRQGYLPFTTPQALTALDAVLADGRPQVMAARIDWQRWAVTARREATLPRLAHLVPVSTGTGPAASSVELSLQDLSPERRIEVVVERVRAIVARLLGLAPARVDPDRSLYDLGFDSLIAVELTVILRNDFGVELPVLQLLREMTVGGLAEVVLQQLASRPELMRLPSSVIPDVPKAPGEGVDQPAEVTVPTVSAAEATAATPGPVSATPSAEVLRYSSLDYHRLTRAQERVKRAVIGATRPLAVLDLDGAEYLATAGPYVLATNHLTLLDVPLVLSVMPRPAVIFAAPELRRYPWIDWLLADLGNAIYVDRGAGDTEAIELGLAVLRAGGVLGLSPEGVRSQQLTRAKTGAARLAAGAGAPVVPLAIWGQEDLIGQWRHGRRARVHIRVGAPIPAPGPSSAEAVPYTNLIMSRIAAMLPPSYRGVYADEVR